MQADTGSPGCPRRDDRRAGRPVPSPPIALLRWLGVALLVVLAWPTDAYAQEGGGGGLISIGALVVTGLNFLFRLFGGGVSGAVKRALEGLRTGIVDVAEALAKGLVQTATIFGSVWSFFRKFWDRVLLPLVRNLDRWVGRFFKWLKDTFGPIIEFLIEVRKQILKFYDKWLKPIFDTIDVIRRVLGIFSLFGLEWARELDRKLAELQDRLMQPIRLVLQKVNEIIDVLDRIVTLDGLLQRFTLLRSVVRDIYSVAGIWQRAFSKPVTADDYAKRRQQAGARTIDQVRRDTAEVLTTGGGPFGPFVSEWADIWRAELEARR